MHRKKFFISLLAILLILGSIIGLIGLAKKIDEDIDSVRGDITEKESSIVSGDESSNSVDNSSGSLETPSNIPSYFTDGYVGFRTIGNETYFFIDCNKWALTRSNDIYYERCYSYLDVDKVKPYSDFQPIILTSNDTLTWRECLNESETSYIPDAFLSASGEHMQVYLTYTVISNCSNPLTVLSDLKNNVFDNYDVFGLSCVG